MSAFLFAVGGGASRAPLATAGEDCSDSANAMSLADWNRFSRSFSRQCRTMWSRAGEMLRPDSDSSGGSSFRIADDRVARGVPLERLPARQHLVKDRAEREDVRARGRRQPPHLFGRHVAHRPHDRARSPCDPRPSARSSARREATASILFARPKSRIFTWPSRVTKRFSGFRSRWTMPFSWAAERPFATWSA